MRTDNGNDDDGGHTAGVKSKHREPIDPDEKHAWNSRVIPYLSTEKSELFFPPHSDFKRFPNNLAFRRVKHDYVRLSCNAHVWNICPRTRGAIMFARRAARRLNRARKRE